MMKYMELLEEAKKIKEFKIEYDKQISNDSIDVDSGNHIVFGYVFNPLLFNSIKNKNYELSNKLLDFLERMASSDDRLVMEVCDFTVLEELHDLIPDDALYPLLGDKTKEGFKTIMKYMKPNHSWGEI